MNSMKVKIIGSQKTKDTHIVVVEVVEGGEDRVLLGGAELEANNFQEVLP